MAENLLTDARVRTANRERDGLYLSDGGGLRIRLLPPSRKHPKGARLAEYHFKLKDAAGEPGPDSLGFAVPVAAPWRTAGLSGTGSASPRGTASRTGCPRRSAGGS